MGTDTALPLGMLGEVVAPPPTTKAQRRKWLEARRSLLGASDVATILHMAPSSWDTSELKVWLEKTDPEYLGDEPTERMLWGLRLERPIADEYRVRHARQNGVYVAPTPGLIVRPEWPWLGCTPDRLLLDIETRTTALGLLEIKTGGYTTMSEWRDGVPPHYQIQVQVQMGITGMPWADVVPLFGGNQMPTPYRLDFDPLAFQQIVEITGAWWERHIVPRVPPEPVVGDLPVLPDLWPGDGSTVTLPAALAAQLRQRVRLAKRIKQLEDAKDRVDLRVKTHMRDANTAYDEQGNAVATWTRYTRSTFDKKALERDHPALAKKYTTRTGSQRFNVTAQVEEEGHSE